jgi:hypothetical protein
LKYFIYHKHTHGSLILIFNINLKLILVNKFTFWKKKYRAQTSKVKPRIKCITFKEVYIIIHVAKNGHPIMCFNHLGSLSNDKLLWCMPLAQVWTHYSINWISILNYYWIFNDKNNSIFVAPYVKICKITSIKCYFSRSFQ